MGIRMGGNDGRWMGVALTAGMLVGCASTLPGDATTTSGRVGARDITRALPAGEWVIADNESFLMPLEEAGNLPPEYPGQLLARRLPPQRVCLRLSIGPDGRVFDSTPLPASADCPPDGAVPPAFLAAAREAVAGWRFDPAFRCVYADAAQKADAGEGCNGGEIVPEAVSLAYRFDFEQHDGRGSVRVGD